MALIISPEIFDSNIAAIAELDDDWTLHQAPSYLTKRLRHDTVTVEYHITYNISYGVPVLSFVAYRPNGTQLQSEECASLFRFEDASQVLTQMDHPVLQRPFLTLHPCRTSEMLASYDSSDNLVVSWLSCVGPFVGLKLSEEYFALTRRD